MNRSVLLEADLLKYWLQTWRKRQRKTTRKVRYMLVLLHESISETGWLQSPHDLFYMSSLCMSWIEIYVTIWLNSANGKRRITDTFYLFKRQKIKQKTLFRRLVHTTHFIFVLPLKYHFSKKENEKTDT